MKGCIFLRDKRAILLEDLITEGIKLARSMGFRPVVMPLVLTWETYPWCFDVVKGDKNYGKLRAEGTEQYIRNLLEGKNFYNYYWGPMFRSERSQSFRRREFYQFCLETVAKNSTELKEITCLKVLTNFLTRFLPKEELLFIFNSLGTDEDKEEMIKYFQGLAKLEREPLIHLLDQRKYRYSFSSIEFVSPSSMKEACQVIQEFIPTGINWKWDPSLFRGIHYYNNLIFEVKFKGVTIAGGGRYDGLWGLINAKKKKYKHFGFGIGLTRIVELLEE